MTPSLFVLDRGLGRPARLHRALYGSESSVVRRLSGNGAHEAMGRRAIACFDAAMDDAGVGDPRLRQALHDDVAWTTHRTMGAYPHGADDVPDDLRLPRWSWDGLQQSSNRLA